MNIQILLVVTCSLFALSFELNLYKIKNICSVQHTFYVLKFKNTLMSLLLTIRRDFKWEDIGRKSITKNIKWESILQNLCTVDIQYIIKYTSHKYISKHIKTRKISSKDLWWLFLGGESYIFNFFLLSIKTCILNLFFKSYLKIYPFYI